jgi:integrase
MGKLTARKVETAPAGKYGDGGGLQLSVSATGSRKWVLRYTRVGKAREMGLGAFPEVGLAEARERAIDARRVLRDGRDPIAARIRLSAVPTFGVLADEIVVELAAGFRNEKHVAQWKMTLRVYAGPIRDIAVNEIDTSDVLSVPRPIWLTKPETASRVRGRIEKVLNAAKAKGLRAGENPAAWRGHLENLLPRRKRLSRGHHPALPYREVRALTGRLRDTNSMAGRALEFTILTAARSGEALGARWEEFDLEEGIWTIPPYRMKASREHRVPLSDRALAIVTELNNLRTSDYVFSGRVAGRPLSAMAMEMVLRRLKVSKATVHGFRSSFRDWSGNETAFPREIAEQALAHVVGDQTEQAYRRSDALERRRTLMQAWAKFCEPDADENIIAMDRYRI